ncbi:macrophage colony-stimulating factor 1 receptor isoform X2 [Brienomyrus brachyistius]|uniref:macrophage colony-stimulating factor 1 receptor isoform X2 n=1 Tax=Brienomyrus brachyistius TaxID=42636 RepID=UPI0020B33ED3|nr:macrophage colony-stimulating factor 1 receptor isoform X2 [Brienomyrus brachyistius]
MFILLVTFSFLTFLCDAQQRPMITLNFMTVTQDYVVVRVNKPFALTCMGRNVTWVPRLSKHSRHITDKNGVLSIFEVVKPTVDYTGTYKCYSRNQPDLSSSVHVYVKDPQNLFTSPYMYRPVKKEGDDLLLPCLLTDPDATEFSLRMDNGTSVPQSMNYTTDPRKGIFIWHLQPSFIADYVCSARVNGVEKISRPFSINVIERLRFPPYVFLDEVEYVRIVGESFQISCKTHNPNFNYNVTWKHSSRNKLNVEEKVNAMDTEGNRLDIESILTIPAVNLSDTGNITCTGSNEAGVNRTTTYLKVVEKPYIRLSAELSPKVTREDLSVMLNEGEDLELVVNIEAYPEIKDQGWRTSASQNNFSESSSFYRYKNRYVAKLVLKRMTSQEQGWYTFYARSELINNSISFKVQIYQKPSVAVKWENGTTLTCNAFGFPAPNIHWYQCSGIRTTCRENTTGALMALPAQILEVQNEASSQAEVESSLPVGPVSRRTTFECVASNLVGEASNAFSMEVSQNKLFMPTLVGASTLAAVFLLLLVILLYKYKQKPRYEIRWKIIEASNGNNYTFIDPMHLPYNEKWEFPRAQLKLGKVLGAGAFGKVVEATAYGLGQEDNVTRVAVKMLKPSAHSDEKEALISELKILSHLGEHKNIVNLLGACTHGGPVLVITEYCRHGDLLNFLRNKADTFLSFVMSMPDCQEETIDYKNVCLDKKYIRSDSGISSSCSDSYQEMKPAPLLLPASTNVPPCDNTVEDSWPLDIDDLLRFSYQVAQGLEFLTAKNCIHRDVAARNVLLADSRVAKICDFGLARDIMNDSNYVVKGNARLPVKWMAPESIFDCVYTVQSDVWSYGILLWEIFSLGKSPYPSVLVDGKFYKMIKCGYQMSRPDYAPPEMYTIMKMCWDLEPTRRPTFSKIGQLIERLLGEQPDQQDAPDGEPSESREAPKCCEGSYDQSCDQEEEEQPLMKTNNYKLC